ncbi:NADPH-dependent F420 reductase [Propionibacterium australiense]|uniref:NADP oxidoreductase n=1 Tax=Propionibacterium australiense TaxID=119981 RepID=A0A383S6G8_9ACTN|nr:NAD(P)-binding domain-containing protein [Propionibacterium australiense]RLP09671.1 NADP oxidoreductase [Propionibacterium australiense]RLP12373.1 NADP oxidoreductase [Propionibacterium australiense]SYZ33578.1 NADP oxidoreductase coenzyme F420-dependent [Propionibacterium australiense]VEH89536.1 Uncharacterized conserved protein [Propionibacterium australiense]
MGIGIIGAGAIGSAIARLATGAGIDVVIANSRGPETLGGLVADLGPTASAGTVAQAAQAGDVIVLAVPPNAMDGFPTGLFDERIVLDTSNYYPYRDGRIAELDTGEVTNAERAQRKLPRARLIKAFSNILAPHIPLLAREHGASDRSALPVAGDDEKARAVVMELVDRLGFDPVDAGTAADAWRFEPETAAYTPIYLAAPLNPGDDIFTAPVSPTSATQLRDALERAERVDVAARVY